MWELRSLLTLTGFDLPSLSGVASLLTTSECIITDAPKKNAEAPAMPGGGMGGMY